MKFLKILRIAIFAVLFTMNPGPKVDYAQDITGSSLMANTSNAIVVSEKHEEKNKFVFNIPKKKSHQAFLRSVGFRESSNRYDTINKYGFLGKYQFSEKTLKGLGIKTEPQLFLRDKDLQEYAMHKYLKYNSLVLKDIINKYNDTTIFVNHRIVYDTTLDITHNLYADTLLVTDTAFIVNMVDVYDTIYVTTSGILAAAHLGGAGNVKKFFRKLENKELYNPKDKLGTSLTDYMSTFSGYSLALK